MGMAYPTPCPKWPIADIPGLVRCQWCGAQYKRGNWRYGPRPSRCSTESSREVWGSVPDDVCPICHHKENTEPTWW